MSVAVIEIQPSIVCVPLSNAFVVPLKPSKVRAAMTSACLAQFLARSTAGGSKVFRSRLVRYRMRGVACHLEALVDYACIIFALI